MRHLKVNELSLDEIRGGIRLLNARLIMFVKS